MTYDDRLMIYGEINAACINVKQPGQAGIMITVLQDCMTS